MLGSLAFLVWISNKIRYIRNMKYENAFMSSMFCHLNFEREKFCGNFGEFFLAFFLSQFCVQQTKHKLQTRKGKLYINTARNGCERFYSNGVEYYKAVRFKNITMFSSCHNWSEQRAMCRFKLYVAVGTEREKMF